MEHRQDDYVPLALHNRGPAMNQQDNHTNSPQITIKDVPIPPGYPGPRGDLTKANLSSLLGYHNYAQPASSRAILATNKQQKKSRPCSKKRKPSFNNLPANQGESANQHLPTQAGTPAQTTRQPQHRGVIQFPDQHLGSNNGLGVLSTILAESPKFDR